MDTWILLLLAAAFGSAVSLVGGFYLLYGKWGVTRLQRLSVPFAAGALLAAAFFDLLPEALAGKSPNKVLTVTLIGFLFFFVLERSLSWFHHHHEEEQRHTVGRRNSALIIVGDTIHNFIDGMAIGASFLVSPAIGIVTTLAIAAHEIPQEIGDFGLLLAKGMSRRKVLWVNLMIAVVTILGAALVYGMGGVFLIPEEYLLGSTAGFFIYIAASDIIPTIHDQPSRRVANIQTLILVFGVIFVAASIETAHAVLTR